MAAADAHGGQAVTAIAVFQAVQQRGENAGTAATKWMADGDGTTPGVDLGGVEAAFANHRDALRGEGLVQFNGIELIQGETQATQNFPRGGHRADAHAIRLHARNGATQDASTGFQTGGLGG